mgnify:CR=1 FL=1
MADRVAPADGRRGDATRTDRQPARCVTCHARLDLTEWHPVATATDADGAFHVHGFCSPRCRVRWRRRQSDAD